MTLHQINKLLSLESIPVYGNIDLGQKCFNKVHQTIDAMETAK